MTAPLTTNEASRWRRWAAYMKCKEVGHLSRDHDHRCKRCGTTYRYVRTMVEADPPSRALCPEEHWRGVACGTEGCSW